MAEDTELAPEGELEPLDTPAEEDTPPAPKTVEDFARERGWKPKEEFEPADGKEWRDAETFLAFGLDRNRDLITDVKQLRETTERMARTQAEITQQAVDRARAEERALHERRLEKAVEEGDTTTAFQATQKIAELSQPAPQQPGLDPTVAQFQRDNPWLGTDHGATALALAEADRVTRAGGTVAEQLDAARKAVHKRFPEYAPAQPKAAPAVAAPTTRVPPARSGKKGFSDLSADEQKVAKEMVRRKLIPNVDAYVEHAFGEGAV